MSRKLRRLKGRLAVPAIRACMHLVSRLRLRTAGRLGEALGRAAFHTMPGVRARTEANLEIAFPERSPLERRRIAVGTFRLLGTCALEWIVHAGTGVEKAVTAVRGTPGWEHLERASARGRGLIIVSPHFGMFELMPVYVKARGFPGKVVGRRYSDGGYESIVIGGRARMGVPTIPQHQAREMLRVLKKGQILGTLPDQDVDKLPGIFIPFFGRPAYTVTGPATLAITTGAALLPAFMHRVSRGNHRLVIHPEIDDPGGDDRDARVRAMTKAYTRVFEEEIRAAPEHWAWIHRRWATTPERLRRRRARRARLQAAETRARLAADRQSS